MPPHGNPADEEDDYMSMVIEEPQQKETFAQKKLRKQREAEARARVPSKAERAAQEAALRDAALSTSTLNPSNKGFQMMAKLGFKPGEALGKRPASIDTTNGADSSSADSATPLRTEPLNLIFKEDRGGIGLDAERKRKFREEAEEMVKKVKAEEGDYRDRVRMERETRRTEAQVHAAQKVAERLDTEAETEERGQRQEEAKAEGSDSEQVEEEKEDNDEADDHKQSPSLGRAAKKTKIKPTLQIPVLYRGLVRDREEKERSILARHALQTSVPSSFFPTPRLPGYNDPDIEREDKQALLDDVRREDPTIAGVEQELEEDDPELDAFNALEPGERLMQLVMYLREKHQYCFWCKYRYETQEMDGCPGVTEEDHD